MIATVPRYGEKEPKKIDAQHRRTYHSFIQFIIEKAEKEEKTLAIENSLNNIDNYIYIIMYLFFSKNWFFKKKYSSLN